MEIRELIEAYKCGYEDAVKDFQKKEKEKNERLLKALQAARDARKRPADDAAKEEMNERITEDLKALCARREVPLTQVADVMQKMFDEGVCGKRG